MDLFVELQNKRIFETQNYFSAQKRIASETLSVLLSVQKEIGEQIVNYQNFIQTLEEKSTNLINNLKETEEKFLHLFKNTENINEKQTSECLEKLSEEMTTSLDYGKYLDTTMSKNVSSIVKYLKETKDKFVNQSSIEILKKKDSTFVSLSNCVRKIKIKNSMCEFSSSPFSLTCLFELIFDFIPQDHENFVILRQISKEVQSVVFDKWTCITNVMPLIESVIQIAKTSPN
jgi:hypothetical protein